jgi:hypothetical protein
LDLHSSKLSLYLMSKKLKIKLRIKINISN